MCMDLYKGCLMTSVSLSTLPSFPLRPLSAPRPTRRRFSDERFKKLCMCSSTSLPHSAPSSVSKAQPYNREIESRMQVFNIDNWGTMTVPRIVDSALFSCSWTANSYWDWKYCVSMNVHFEMNLFSFDDCSEQAQRHVSLMLVLCVWGGERPHGCGQKHRPNGDQREPSLDGRDRSPDHPQPQHQWVSLTHKHTHTHTLKLMRKNRRNMKIQHRHFYTKACQIWARNWVHHQAVLQRLRKNAIM